jgi:AcrR family transcriptional regulator
MNMQGLIGYRAAVTATPRRYDSSARQAQARRTRARVVEAARRLLVERGYEAMTLGHVARAAEVSVPTIQKAFGTKAALTKAVYDVTLAGDDLPIPMADRPVFARLEAETDPHETLRLYAEIAGELWGRLGALYPAILGGAMSGASDLADLRRTITEESRVGARDVVEQLDRLDGLRPGLGVEEATDLLWWLIQPEQYVVMVVHAGWPLDRFVAWFRENAQRLLLRDPAH